MPLLIVLQRNLYKTDTLGEIESVRLTGVRLIGFSILGQYLENNENENENENGKHVKKIWDGNDQ